MALFLGGSGVQMAEAVVGFSESLAFLAGLEWNKPKYNDLEDDVRPPLRAALAELGIPTESIELLVEAKWFRLNSASGKRLTYRDVGWNSLWPHNGAPQLASLRAWGTIPPDSHSEVAAAMVVDLEDDNKRIERRGDACTKSGGAALRKLALRSFFNHCKSVIEREPAATLISSTAVDADKIVKQYELASYSSELPLHLRASNSLILK